MCIARYSSTILELEMVFCLNKVIGIDENVIGIFNYFLITFFVVATF